MSVLLRGFPGSGKTHIAKVYGGLLGGYEYYVCNGIVTPPESGIPVILDEVHRLKSEEMWYNYPLIIACTTEGAPISDAFKSRMVERWLDSYSLDDLTLIIHLNTRRLPYPGRKEVAHRCKGSPRIAISLGKQVEAIVAKNPDMGWGEICDELGYYRNGFTANDLNYLDCLLKYQPMSATSLAGTLNLPLETIRTEIEPWLLQRGLIRITSRGRCLNG